MTSITAQWTCSRMGNFWTGAVSVTDRLPRYPQVIVSEKGNFLYFVCYFPAGRQDGWSVIAGTFWLSLLIKQISNQLPEWMLHCSQSSHSVFAEAWRVQAIFCVRHLVCGKQLVELYLWWLYSRKGVHAEKGGAHEGTEIPIVTMSFSSYSVCLVNLMTIQLNQEIILGCG